MYQPSPSVLHLLFPSVQFRPVTFQRVNARCTPRLSHLISPVVPDGMCFGVICCALALRESPTALPRWRGNVAVAELHFRTFSIFQGVFSAQLLVLAPAAATLIPTTFADCCLLDVLFLESKVLPTLFLVESQVLSRLSHCHHFGNFHCLLLIFFAALSTPPHSRMNRYTAQHEVRRFALPDVR